MLRSNPSLDGSDSTTSKTKLTSHCKIPSAISKPFLKLSKGRLSQWEGGNSETQKLDVQLRLATEGVDTFYSFTPANSNYKRLSQVHVMDSPDLQEGIISIVSVAPRMEEFSRRESDGDAIKHRNNQPRIEGKNNGNSIPKYLAHGRPRPNSPRINEPQLEGKPPEPNSNFSRRSNSIYDLDHNNSIPPETSLPPPVRNGTLSSPKKSLPRSVNNHSTPALRPNLQTRNRNMSIASRMNAIPHLANNQGRRSKIILMDKLEKLNYGFFLSIAQIESILSIGEVEEALSIHVGKTPSTIGKKSFFSKIKNFGMANSNGSLEEASNRYSMPYTTCLVEGHRQELPLAIFVCIEEIFKRGLQTPHLFSIPGESVRVNQVLKLLESTNPVELSMESIHNICSVLIHFLKLRKSPIFDSRLLPLLLSLSVHSNRSRIDSARILILILSDRDFSLFVYIISFLVQVKLCQDSQSLPTIFDMFSIPIFLPKSVENVGTGSVFDLPIKTATASAASCLEFFLIHWSEIENGLLNEKVQESSLHSSLQVNPPYEPILSPMVLETNRIARISLPISSINSEQRAFRRRSSLPKSSNIAASLSDYVFKPDLSVNQDLIMSKNYQVSPKQIISPFTPPGSERAEKITTINILDDLLELQQDSDYSRGEDSMEPSPRSTGSSNQLSFEYSNYISSPNRMELLDESDSEINVVYSTLRKSERLRKELEATAKTLEHQRDDWQSQHDSVADERDELKKKLEKIEENESALRTEMRSLNLQLADIRAISRELAQVSNSNL